MIEMNIEAEFKEWVSEISRKYKASRAKAVIRVNGEMLGFYYDLGREISKKSYKSTYGSRFYKKLSDELSANLNDSVGLSPVNLRYMERFYNLYNKAIKIFPQLVEELFSIPWGHHRCIIDKCKNPDKALFFIHKISENNWSRDSLLNFLSTNLYERDGRAINNFEKAVPGETKGLANQITKDPYNFSFLAISDRYSEKEMKDALMDNVQKFLLELGNGFAFVGRESRLLVGKTELYSDLLFYNIKIHSYVVIEVKTRGFRPADLGQLSTYISSVNHILKGDGDGPTIGLLICKEKDDVVVEYSLESYNVPLGVSSYELAGVLPSIEEIKTNLKNI